MSKEEIYTVLVAHYKIVPDIISRMTREQQLIMFKAIPSAPDPVFNSMEEYHRWKNANK